MKALDEILVRSEDIEYVPTYPGHDVHIDHDVFGVGDLYADVGECGANWSHAKRNDIHGTSFH
jgi:hypothetical protein